MKVPLLLASLVVTAATAHADPTRYVQTDVMIGGAAPVVGPNLLGAVEGGYQLRPGLWIHGELAAGPAADDQGTGSNTQIRAGIEGRGCVQHGVLCGVVGADLGALHGTWTARPDRMMSEQVDAVVLVPRIGIDIGGRSVRGRLGLELDEALAGRRQSSFTSTTTVNGTIGLELAAGVAYQW